MINKAIVFADNNLCLFDLISNMRERNLTFDEAWKLYKQGGIYDSTGIILAEVKRRRTGEKPKYRIKVKTERI